MGLFKSGVKGVGKVIGAPAKFVFPRAVRKTGSSLFSYKVSKSIYCPNCGESYLKLLPASEVSNGLMDNAFNTENIISFDHCAFWYCPECSFGYAANIKDDEQASTTIEDVKEFVRQNGRELISDDFDSMSEESIEIMKSQMRAAYSFYTAAFFATLLLLYGVYSGGWLFCICIMLFVATFMLIGFRWSYRAWQHYTGNLYADDPKQQFFDWLSNNNPFKAPYL